MNLEIIALGELLAEFNQTRAGDPPTASAPRTRLFDRVMAPARPSRC
jgi:hypothetical protein